MCSVECAGPQSSDFVFEVEHWLNCHWKYSIMYTEDVKLINQMQFLQTGNIMSSEDLKQA
jgi:hypothetical protein